MNDRTYQTMSDGLVQSVPELKDAYQRELAWWKGEEPGQHIIYGTLLNPLLLSLLDEEGTPEALHRIFGFLERLATHEDVHVREVLAVTVLEGILGRGGSAAWKKAHPLMGPSTRRIAAKVERLLVEGVVLRDI